MHGSVQQLAEAKVDAVLRVQADADRLVASVRVLLEAEHILHAAQEAQMKALSVGTRAVQR